MSAKFWSGLFELREAVDRASFGAAKRLGAAPTSDEVSTQTAGVVLAELHLDVRQALERCLAGVLEPHFTGFSDRTSLTQALCLVSYWVNERVRRDLPTKDCPDFVPVGPEAANLQGGGCQFFSDVDDFCAGLERGTSSFSADPADEVLAELALFCLEQGFQGKYETEPSKLESYKARLRRRPVAPPPPRAKPVPLLPVRRAPWIAASVLSIVAFYLLCALISNTLGVG